MFGALIGLSRDALSARQAALEIAAHLHRHQSPPLKSAGVGFKFAPK